MKRHILAIAILLFVFSFNVCFAEENMQTIDRNRNSLTLIDQQDRQVEIKPAKEVKTKNGVSILTGEKSKESFQPVLVELNNENGGVFSIAPEGITQASIIYEYQVYTNGTTGMCALFQDKLPSSVGPIGNASVGGVLIQSDWNCGYVFNDIPQNSDGTVSELGYSIQQWMDTNGLSNGITLFPASASIVKEWKKYFKEDESLFIDQNYFVDVSGIKNLLTKEKNKANAIAFKFNSEVKPAEESTGIPVSEVDIRLPSRAYSSGFVYNSENQKYYRWIGENSQYGDVTADEQLTVSNVIVQRVNYSTSNGLMAPITIGRGNADIFTKGVYIEGYWVRDSVNDHTRFYDCDGNLIELNTGSTFISLMTNSTSVVIFNY